MNIPEKLKKEYKEKLSNLIEYNFLFSCMPLGVENFLIYSFNFSLSSTTSKPFKIPIINMPRLWG